MCRCKTRPLTVLIPLGGDASGSLEGDACPDVAYAGAVPAFTTRSRLKVHVDIGWLLVEAKVDDVGLEVRCLEGDEVTCMNHNGALGGRRVRGLDSDSLAV